MAETQVSAVMLDLQRQLKTSNIQVANLSTIAKHGDEKLVEKFLSEAIFVQNDGQSQLAVSHSKVLESQLYVSCFWGFRDIVKGILTLSNEQDICVDVNRQNKSTLWSPLHAATFQEHGPIIMMLLEHGAEPELPDSDGRTPKDFASASDKAWGHFSALGLKRTPRPVLIELGIIKKADTLSTTPLTSPRGGNASPREPGKGIRMAMYEGPDTATDNIQFTQAAVTGDVLANNDDSDFSSQPQPQFSAYK